MQSQQPNQEASNGFDLNSIPKPELSGHAWRQQGTMLICQSCPFTHASHLPVGYQLYGIDERGYPLIRKVVVKD